MGHSDVVLGGPLWWVSVAFFVGSWALGLFVLVDSVRPVRVARLAELPESRWLYTGVSALYVLGVSLLLLLQVAGITTPTLAIAAVGIAPFMLILGFAYLLRAVFSARGEGS